MKKSVSELKQDLAAANRQIAQAKKSGNKRQLNLGRHKRLETWRVLRDEHGMEPPPHIAKALGKPKGKKKEPTEFTKPKEGAAKVAEMDFTKFASKAEEKAFFADQERAMGKITVAKKTETTTKKPSAQELRKQVQAWLNKDKEYAKLEKKISQHMKIAGDALETAKSLGKQTSEEMMLTLDDLFVHRHSAIETEAKLLKLMKEKKARFEKEHASEPALVKAYSARLAALDEKHTRNVLFPFTEEENRLMGKSEYSYHERKREAREKQLRAEMKVRGKNRLQEEMKRKLLEKAQDLLDELEEPTPEEEETMGKIRGAAKDSSVDAKGMLGIALGEDVSEEDKEGVELALLASTVDELETKVAVAERRRPKVARASPRKGKKGRKGPVKVASLTRRKKEGKGA